MWKAFLYIDTSAPTFLFDECRRKRQDANQSRLLVLNDYSYLRFFGQGLQGKYSFPASFPGAIR